MNEQAYIESKPKFSVIWIVPVIAIVITGWMLYQHQSNKGHTIFLKMDNADGIIAGKTEIKVRSVQVGLVESLKLQIEQNAVIATIRIFKDYDTLLTKDAKFWTVKPRVDESGISGLNTLLSGAYIELLPGESNEQASLFTMQNQPALIAPDIEGLRYSLKAANAEVLDVGTGIFFRNYKIGQVETASFNEKTLEMDYGIFINSPYNELISKNAIFWVNSGIEVDLSTEGIRVSTGSLSKLIKGGISVDYPPNTEADGIAEQNTQYKLHKNFAVALERRFDLFDLYLIEFEQSIKGLKPGAPVEYRGMRIGTVEQVPAHIVRNGQPLYFQQDNTSIPVLIKVEYGRIYDVDEQAKLYWQSNIEKWIRNGLRASLKSGNLLTGAVYIELDFYSAAKPDTIAKHSVYPVLPSVPSGFTALSEQVIALLNKLNKLPLDDTLSEANKTLVAYKQLGNETKQLIENLNNKKVPEKVDKNLTQLQGTLTQLTSSLKQFEKTLSTYQQGSGVMEQLTDTLSELESLSNTLKPVTKGLNEQPNMLIFDKDASEDPTPRKR
ncbi:intermembrane transport protein PqiB [Pseudoalteromonas luteoviolacea]|uniref:Mammalian cell entry protein n=1 Tax=Pseudoalteromonas luteoviolacea H33 TaxID=1365251 RepID=A0A167B733_9GAMM|nr:intermembrane transport protein PqiB [Pseudoalteromonas luteoviolacea]KZN46212.1 mammalian cell entry protein [Pseudoalteromonas luteoviolacea H33]KZN75133.1 mammalian cell entry protein [Pseudoalteromonas luteoviolacea H33-S]MBQ4875850.1 intermembrane transport protein PqiB [Pseudoalteromonas luteoviolacea]MBQ4904885.1 intermembrane transport protein PqiB [Pseudoalteromonas luteoviolacea]